MQARLLAQYGELLGGQDLPRVLAYPSSAAFQQAARRGLLPVRAFAIPHRRGLFAYTVEVGQWLRTVGHSNQNQDSTGSQPV